MKGTRIITTDCTLNESGLWLQKQNKFMQFWWHPQKHLEGYFRFRAPDVDEGSRKLEDAQSLPESTSSPGRPKEAEHRKSFPEGALGRLHGQIVSSLWPEDRIMEGRF